MSEFTDLFDLTKLGAEESFGRYPSCFAGCGGHADPSTRHSHSTALEFFGEYGITVAQFDGQPAQVKHVDQPTPEAVYTPNEARLVAYQFLLAADYADRLNMPTVSAALALELGEKLARITD